MALLRGQVHRADALPGDGVGVRAVLQQGGGDVHLILLGSNVQRSVAILEGKQGELTARVHSMVLRYLS